MSTNEVVYAELLFTFGSVMVYELKPKVYDLFNQPVYYWRYKDTSMTWGPFNSVMECTRHWEESTRGAQPISQEEGLAKAKEIEQATNVIRVDFKNKKRIKRKN